VREVTLAPAVERQLADSVGGGLESYYWISGQYDGAATDSQAARLPAQEVVPGIDHDQRRPRPVEHEFRAWEDLPGLLAAPRKPG
jgi:hypothetical protein